MKAKKTKSSKARTVSKSSQVLGLKKLDYHSDAKAVVSLFILLLALGILLVFTSYKNTIIAMGNFQLFMVLSVVCMGFLIGLLFLVSKHHRK